jgi:synaptic vesicle membrane protein VAT-1
MRAIVVKRYGNPDVLEMREMPDPQPKAGEILIRVRAVGVNFADLLQRMGIYPGVPKPPFVPGFEVAGVVEKVTDAGRDAESEPLRTGDAVCAIAQYQGYSEWVTVPARLVYRLPSGMPFDEAAALPVNYLTAYHAMFAMGNLQTGDRILIHGAAGGVGIAAVQLAKARGLEIFGTAGPSKQDYLRKIGVDHAIDYEKSDFVEVVRKFSPDGIEMAMDAIGGKSFANSYKCLGPTGRLVVYGFSAAAGPDGKKSSVRGLGALLQTPRFNPLKLMADNISVIGINLGKMASRTGLMRTEMEEIFKLYQAGKIKPLVGKSFPLGDAAAAHKYIHARKNIGKVILNVK